MNVPAILILLALLAMPAYRYWKWFKYLRWKWRAIDHYEKVDRRQMGLCPQCGYDLRASSERCPECGASTGSTGAHPGDRNPQLLSRHRK